MGWIVFGVFIAIALFFVSIYNRLVGGRNGYKNAFAQIDVQLTRRHDLIPNLVETAKGYIKHERETLEAVITARNSAVSGLKRAAANPGDPSSVQQLAGAEAALNGALGRLFAVAEAYPDLKANQNMMQLSEELTTTENKVAFARQVVQRRGHELQQPARDVPQQHRCRHVHVHPGAAAGDRGAGEARRPAGEVL